MKKNTKHTGSVWCTLMGAVCCCVLSGIAVPLCAQSVALPEAVSAADMPDGWASYQGKKDLSGNSVSAPAAFGGSAATPQHIFTVSNRAALLDALKTAGAKIIYVQGMIDMTDSGNGTMLPPKVTGSTPALDAFVAKYTRTASDDSLKVASWNEWKTAYGAHVVSTEDHSGAAKSTLLALRAAWKAQITVPVTSDTTIIGLTELSGIRGGAVAIQKVRNVVLRNLHIYDAFDPFPEMQGNDGLNAEYDAISVKSSQYVWIDHCTLADTVALNDNDLGKIKTKDGMRTKWQVYDGLCDITNTCDFVTVSWCTFLNHDKTMLIGSSDKLTADAGHQTVTLHHNLYSGCSQRLPMVRFATIHIYNNVYDVPENASRKNTYAVGVRKDAQIVAENNWFGSGIGYSFRDANGSVYAAGNIDKSRAGCKTPLVDNMPWIPADYYTPAEFQSAEAAEVSVRAGAGAGKLPVIR